MAFKPGDQVFRGRGYTAWTVLESYIDDGRECLVINCRHQRDPLVVHADTCRRAGPEPMPVSYDVEAMAAGIGTAISAARAVGSPDPTDDEFYFALQLNGQPPANVRCGAFQRAKAMAFDALKIGAEACALALFVAAVLMWSIGLGGAA